MGDWRSGSATALQAVGRGFKSLIAHHEIKRPSNGAFSFIKRKPVRRSPKNMNDTRKHIIRRFGIAAALLLLSGALMVLFDHANGAFFPGYRAFSKAVIGALAAITGIFPFSIWDFLTVGLILAAIVTCIFCLVKKRSFGKWLATVCIVLSALVLFMVGSWGLNHYAPPLSTDLGLDVREYSADELEDATSYYLQQAAARAQSVPRGQDMSLERQDFYELAGIAGSSYATLAQQYPVFEGSTAPVKALLLAGEPLLYSGHTGIFWPFTGEANVPLNCAVAEAPFTMAHEAAHRLGIASEQEANFCAFLACTENDDDCFAYSGYYEAFCYCVNALAANYPERANALLTEAIGETADPSNAQTYGARLVLFDRYNTSDFYSTYEGPASDVGTAVNDTYLKSFSEESGVKSYGEVADYLIAWHLAHQ